MSSTSSLIMAVVLAFALAWFPRSLHADGNPPNWLASSLG